MADEFDMSPLTELPLDKFKQLTDSLVDEMIGRIPQPWNDFVSDLDWSEETSSCLKERLTKIVTDATYIPDEDRDSLLRSIFDSDKSDHVSRRIADDKLHLARAFLKRHNAKVMPVLSDNNWSVKWVLGDSTCTAAKYPLVRLDMFLASDGDRQCQDISLEMTRKELDLLISTLEEHI